MTTFENACDLLARATRPEDVFGIAANQSKITDEWKRLLKLVHEDKQRTAKAKAKAKEATIALERFREQAVSKLARGTYGKKDTVDVTLTLGKTEYHLEERLGAGDLSELYLGSDQRGRTILAKLAKHPSVNDLLANEGRMLKKARDFNKDKKSVAHLPELLDSFEAASGVRRRANVFLSLPDFVSLATVIEQYSNGVDPRDAAWMLNRILVAVALAHDAGVIHGAINPDHILIRAEDHHALLVDWSYAVESGQTIKAIAPKWKGFYAPEVLAKKPATPATDLYMLGKTAILLLGDTDVPGANRIKKFWQSFLLANPSRRPDDAWAMWEEFNDLLKALYGPKKFRPFAVNKKSTTTEV